MTNKDFEEKVILPFIANCGFKAGDKIWTYITDERKTCFAIYNLTVKFVAATYDGPAFLGKLKPIVEIEEEGKFAGIGYNQGFTAIFKTREECIEAARRHIEAYHRKRIERARRIIEKSEEALRMIEEGEPHVSQERVTAMIYLECDKRTIGPTVKYKYVSVPPSNTEVLMQENDEDTLAMIENVLKEEFAKRATTMDEQRNALETVQIAGVLDNFILQYNESAWRYADLEDTVDVIKGFLTDKNKEKRK